MNDIAPTGRSNPFADMDERRENTILRVYNRIRKYIEHEDTLVNDRISRTLLVHGFLLASGVLLIQSRVEAVAKCMGRDQGCWSGITENVHLLVPGQLTLALLLVDLLLPIIAMIGIITTRAALSGVVAAEGSVTNVRLYWQEFASKHRVEVDHLHLPDVTGGGSAALEEKGHGSAVNLLRNLLILWFVIFLLVVSLVFVWHWPALSKWILVEKLLAALA